MNFTTFTTALSIMLVLDQAFALVLRMPVDYIHSRQLSIGQTPPQCRDVCSAISNAVDNCTNDTCLCTVSNAIALQDCMNCIYSVSPTEAVRESVENAFNQFEAAEPSTTNLASSVGVGGSSSSTTPPVVTITASFPTTETVYSTTSTHTPSTTVTVVVTHIVPPGTNPSSASSSISSANQSSSAVSSNTGFYRRASTSLIGAISLLSVFLICL
ncbi:hypothetical protein BDQ17DRAFT_551292 [Cyathus striatus]|nr:hypothetical protein BDQ17DRAFT_551292 [Cyathus striatus]